MTPDDMFEKIEHIATEDNNRKEIKKTVYRARQNVIFEYGYFVGKLSRKNVMVIYKENMEIPSDILGVEYVAIKESVDEIEFKIMKKLEISKII